MADIGRNDLCWCGSGKKWKRCHLPELKPHALKQSSEVLLGRSGNDLLGRMVGIEARIRRERSEDTRPLPSSHAILLSGGVDLETMRVLLDTCARIVDHAGELGRCNMCKYFSALVRHGLLSLGHQAEVCIGEATYMVALNSGPPFKWEHSWVRFGNETIDGNIDSLRDNALAPEGLKPKAYWGPSTDLPDDRVLLVSRSMSVEQEADELNLIEIQAYKVELNAFLQRWVSAKSC